jgi:Tol biopolymer transport system component
MRRKLLRTVACAFAALVAALGLASCEGPAWRPAAPGTVKLVVRETSLGQTSGRKFVETPVISPDSRRLAYIEQRGPKQRLVVDGADGPEYDEVLVPVFSPDSSRIAYAARRGKQWFAVLDGREGPPFGCPMIPVFSPDSRRLGYVAWRAKAKFSGERPRPEGKYYDIFDLPWYPNRARWYRSGDGLYLPAVVHEQACYTVRKSAACLVVDGSAGKTYEEIEDGPIFSPDSRRVACTVRSGKKRRVVVDGVEGELFDDIGTVIRFSPDSRHVAYLGGIWEPVGDADSENGTSKMWLVLDGKKSPTYDGVCTCAFSPDSSHLAYAARLGKTLILALDGEETARFNIPDVTVAPRSASVRGPMIVPDTYGRPRFSPDSRRVAYLVSLAPEDRGPAQFFVFMDGRKGKEHDREIQYGPIFSPDSRHMFYVIEPPWEGRDEMRVSTLVLDGRESQAPGMISVGNIDGETGPIFSPDSRRLAYIAHRSGSLLDMDVDFVVVDGRAYGPYDRIESGPVFSPDSRHFAFVGFREGEVHVVVDGVDGPVYDGVLSLAFSPDSRHLAYLAWRGRQVYVVVDGNETEARYKQILGESKVVFSGPDSFYVLAGRNGELLRVEMQIVHP